MAFSTEQIYSLVFPSPFRGLYLQIQWATRIMCEAKEFPSPFRGLYLQIRYVSIAIAKEPGFPSPFRGLYLQIYESDDYEKPIGLKFPAPFRGLYLQIICIQRLQ